MFMKIQDLFYRGHNVYENKGTCLKPQVENYVMMQVDVKAAFAIFW